MPGTLQRFGFDKLKDHFSSRRDKRPSTSASVPNFRFTKKLRTLDHSHSFKSASLGELHEGSDVVNEQGLLTKEDKSDDDRRTVNDGDEASVCCQLCYTVRTSLSTWIINRTAIHQALREIRQCSLLSLSRM